MPLLILAAIAVGLVLPLQTGINAQLRLALGHPLAAALVSFLVGTVVLAAAVLMLRVPLPLGRAAEQTNWWHWTGGVLGALYIFVAVVLAPRLGAATLIASIVAGQMLASLLLDHFGWVGFAPHPISPARLAGALLVIAGVVLIRR
ncbi:MAG: DMT family transporter [Gemmatimonadales bacterium]